MDGWGTFISTAAAAELPRRAVALKAKRAPGDEICLRKLSDMAHLAGRFAAIISQIDRMPIGRDRISDARPPAAMDGRRKRAIIHRFISWRGKIFRRLEFPSPMIILPQACNLVGRNG